MKTIRILNCSQTRGVYFSHKPSGWKSCALTKKPWNLTRYKVCPNQLNRLKRMERLHRLKSAHVFRSLYTAVVLSFFSFLSVISAGARERNKFQLIPSIFIVQGCRLYFCGNGNRNCSVSWNERFRWSTQQDMAGRSYVSYHGYTRHRGLCRMPSCKLVIRSTFIIT